MKVETKQIIDIFRKDLEKERFIISGLDYKPEFINSKDNRVTPERFYIKTVFEKDYMPAMEIKVTKELFEKVRDRKMINVPVNISQFQDFNVGILKADQFNISLWFSASDLNIKLFEDEQN